MVVWTMAVEEKVDVVDARQSWPEARPDLEWGGGGRVSSPRNLTPRVIREVGKHTHGADRPKV